MFKSMISALTAQNSTETNESEATAMTVPKGVSKIVGVGIAFKAAGMTTLESLSGKLKLKSADMTQNWAGDQEFMLPMLNPLTSGSVALNPYIYATDIAVDPGGTIIPAVTFDMALTITPSWRVQLIYA